MSLLMPEPTEAFTALARTLAEHFNALPGRTPTGEVRLDTRRIDGELVLHGAGENWHLPYSHWHDDLSRLPRRRLQDWCTALVESLIPLLDSERWGQRLLRFRWLHYSVGDSASLILARHGISLEGPIKSTSAHSKRMGGGILCMGADALAFIADDANIPPRHYPHADLLSAHVDDIGVYGFTVTLALRRARARFKVDDHHDNKHHVAYFAGHLPDIAELFYGKEWDGIISHADTVLARDHLHEHMALSGAYVETGQYPESGEVAEAYLARHPEETLHALTRMHWVCAVWQVTGRADKVIDAFLAIDKQLPTHLSQAQTQMLNNMMGPIVSAQHEVQARMLAHYNPDSKLRMHHHNFACLFATVGDQAKAVTALEHAIEQGETWAMLEEEEDFAALLEEEVEAHRLQALIDEHARCAKRQNHEYISPNNHGPADAAELVEVHREAPDTYDNFIAHLGRIATPAAIAYLRELVSDLDAHGDSRAQAFLALVARGEEELTAFAKTQWELDPDPDDGLWLELGNIPEGVEDIGRFKRDLTESFGFEGEFAAETLEPRSRDLEALHTAIAAGDLGTVKDYLEVWGHLRAQRTDTARYYALDAAAQAASREGDESHKAVLSVLLAAAGPHTRAQALVHAASEDNTIAELRALLTAGIDANVRTRGDEQALGRALHNNNVKAAYWLLKHGADPKPHYNPDHPYGRGGEELIDRLLASAIAGELQTPRALLPDNTELEMALRRWLAGLAKLGQAHPDETFYVLGIDEDELRANSEQAFAATLAEHIAHHDERKPTELTAESVGAALGWEGDADEDDLDDLFELAAKFDYGDFDDLDELAGAVNAASARENEEKERLGNPYRDDANTCYRLRYDIDAWSYSVDDTQAEKTQALDLTPLQETREDDERNYAELMRDLLLANRNAIATRLALTKDFIIIAPGQSVTIRGKVRY